jgi:hypothetical protein
MINCEDYMILKKCSSDKYILPKRPAADPKFLDNLMEDLDRQCMYSDKDDNNN